MLSKTLSTAEQIILTHAGAMNSDPRMDSRLSVLSGRACSVDVGMSAAPRPLTVLARSLKSMPDGSATTFDGTACVNGENGKIWMDFRMSSPSPPPPAAAAVDSHVGKFWKAASRPLRARWTPGIICRGKPPSSERGTRKNDFPS